MFDIQSFINKSLQEVEPIFRKYNQCTIIYQNGKHIKTFGTNEGGPTYEIYIDSQSNVLDIKQFTIGY
jgi:hypothetical protein